MSSVEDAVLRNALVRMVPGLKRAILRDSERRPQEFGLEIVLLASVFQIMKEMKAN